MRGIGISSILHGMRDQGSNFCGFREQKFSSFLGSGIEILGKNMGSVTKNVSRYDSDIMH